MAATEPTYAHNFGKYDITKLQAGETVLGKWGGDLGIHETLVRYGTGDNDPFLRYCILLGQGSGLHAIPDWGDRKREALRLAGIRPDDPRAEAVLTLTDEGVQEMRWQWMRISSSMEFAAYTALMEAFYQNCATVEAPIVDGVEALPDINIHIEIDGKENAKEASQRADYMLESIAGLIAGKKSELKEDARQRAIKLRTETGLDLRKLIAEIRALEGELFHGDPDMKQKALELAKPKAKAGGLEDLVMNKRKGK